MNSTIPFRPRLEGDFRARFHLAASKISSDTTQEDIEKLIGHELNWVENECFVNLSQRKKYRAVWLLFRDLIRASWKGNYVDGSLEMSLPDVDNLSGSNLSLPDKKAYMRSWMAESRLERIAFGKDFIKRMEETNAQGHTVLDLIADGKNLAQRLLSLKEGRIKKAVSPYLQLVSEGEKDDFTGLRISDIWRYFRYSWSTPYETTPGRTLQYLVRDACDPNHAIMGIDIGSEIEFKATPSTAATASTPTGTVTAINGVTKEVIGTNLNADGWYTLNGVKLNAAPTEKGIYINNGKKIVIK